MTLYSYFEQKMNRPDLGLLVLRVAFGALIAIFGICKLLDGGPMFQQLGGAMAMFGITWEPKFWGLMCALVEAFGGIFVLLGLFFRPALVLLIVNMVVACAVIPGFVGKPDYSSVDAFDGWLGKIDIPYLYCAVFITLLFTGAGKYAIQGGGGGRSGSSKSRE